MSSRTAHDTVLIPAPAPPGRRRRAACAPASPPAARPPPPTHPPARCGVRTGGSGLRPRQHRRGWARGAARTLVCSVSGVPVVTRMPAPHAHTHTRKHTHTHTLARSLARSLAPRVLGRPDGEYEMKPEREAEGDEEVPKVVIRSGKGVYKMDGNEYEGDWANDNMQGSGNFKFMGGSVYNVSAATLPLTRRGLPRAPRVARSPALGSLRRPTAVSSAPPALPLPRDPPALPRLLHLLPAPWTPHVVCRPPPASQRKISTARNGWMDHRRGHDMRTCSNACAGGFCG